jgi:exosome complex component RRP46
MEDRLYCALSSIVLRHVHPRTLVQIVVQILEAGESTKFNARELSASINSANLALLDAGIPLQGLVVATTIAVIENNVLVEPDQEQLESSTSVHVIAYEIIAGRPQRLLLCESTGLFSEQDLFACLEAAISSCDDIYRSIRLAVKSKVHEDFIWKS